MKYPSFFAFLFCLCFNTAFAQPQDVPPTVVTAGIITGKVMDSLSQKPVEYAAVSVMREGDSLVAGGNISDETGVFKIERLKPGRYTAKIKFIGYTEKTIRGIEVSAGAPETSLGTVVIQPAAQNLDEVEIVSHTEVMEANLDKRVINVEKDLTSTGGTALDVMKNVPSVQVDMDNNVSLRGNSNVRILIDGRVSTLDPATMLQQIPASMVKQIEVITNPSAKYDPDGVSGIINIITKKEKKPGFNGIVTAGMGTGSTKPGGGMENFTLNKYNFSTSLNYQTGKFNFFGSYDGRYGQRWNKGYNYRELYRNDSVFVLDQNSDRMRPGWNHSGKLGMDVNLTKSDLLSVSGNVRGETSRPDENIDYSEYLGGGGFLNHYRRRNRENQDEFGYDVSTTYKHAFKEKGHELVFDAAYSYNDRNSDTRINQSYYNQSGDAYSVDSVVENILSMGNRRNFSAQVDYINPTEKYGRFETGLKYLGRRTSQDITAYTNLNAMQTYIDTNRTNAFEYMDDVFSAYFIYGNSIKQFKYQLGVRAEQAFTQSEQVTLGQKFSRDFANLFPSIHLRYVLKNESEFGLSYSRRINRPNVRDLNPYPDYSDMLNLRVGNPYLRPEYIDSYEFSFGQFKPRLSYTASVFYRQTQNNFYRLRTVDSYTGVSTIAFSNIGVSHSSGVELTYNQTITKWLRVNGNASGFYYLLEADKNYHTPEASNISYTARASINVTVTKTFDMQFTGNYRGPMVAPQGTMKPQGNIDFGCKKDFWNKKASLSFRLSDIFNTQRFAMDLSDVNYASDISFKWESRTAYLTFTYRINDGKEKREKPRGDQGGGPDVGM